MQRLYSQDEMKLYFEERTYFKDMDTVQLQHVCGYIAKKTGKSSEYIENLIAKDGVCGLTDSQVYASLQAIKGVEPADDLQSAIDDYGKMQSLYKKMCKTLSFDFKESIGQVLDIGYAVPKLLQQLRYVFFAKYSQGINVDTKMPSRNDQIVDQLAKFKQEQFDVILCNKTLNAVDDGLVSPVLDQVARLASKYIIIRDYQLQENFNLVKEMVIHKELQNGVLQSSPVPEAIKRANSNPHKLYDQEPADYYNTEFSLQHAIKHLQNCGFSVVYQPQNVKSMGNIAIYILKRDSFQPKQSYDAPSNDQWKKNSDESWTKEAQDQSKKKLAEAAAKLQGKAFTSTHRSDSVQAVGLLINKLLRSNKDSVIPKIVQLLQGATSEDRLTILERILYEVKNSKTQPDVTVAMFSAIAAVNQEAVVTLQDKVIALINELIVAVPKEDEFMLLYAQMESVARFMAHACAFKFFPRKVEMVEIMIGAAEVKPELMTQMIKSLAEPRNRTSKVLRNLNDYLLTRAKELLETAKQGTKMRCLLLNVVEPAQ